MLAQNKEKQLTLTFDAHNFLYFWVFFWCGGNHRLDYQPLLGKMNLHSGN